MLNKSMERSAQKALKAIAKREGISVECVRREIEIAAAAARQNQNPAVRAFWESVPSGGGPLSAEDVIAYIAQVDMGRRN